MDFKAIITKNEKKGISDDAAKKLGESKEEPMDEKYKAFIADVLGMMEKGILNPENPESFVKQDVYEGLNPELKARADLAIVNIANMLRHIIDFYKATNTPNESPELVSMIEQLWHMKEAIEKEADVFVF